jgi:hypothetical protein
MNQRTILLDLRSSEMNQRTNLLFLCFNINNTLMQKNKGYISIPLTSFLY